jgi:hypothetical protein
MGCNHEFKTPADWNQFFGHRGELAQAASVLAMPYGLSRILNTPVFTFGACDVRSKPLPHPTPFQIEYCESASRFKHTFRMRPFEQQFSISAQLSAALQAARASLHPGYFRQDYSLHSLDCGFSGWTTRSNSNFSRSSSVSPEQDLERLSAKNDR